MNLLCTVHLYCNGWRSASPINSLALVFITFIQGIGRPDLSAKLHFLELLIYLPVLLWAIHNYGILGAAIAWTGRVAFDGILLFWLSTRFLSEKAVFKRMTVGILIASGGLIVPLSVDAFIYRVVIVFLMMIIFFFVVWITVLAPDERIYVDSQMRLLIGRRHIDVSSEIIKLKQRLVPVATCAEREEKSFMSDLLISFLVLLGPGI